MNFSATSMHNCNRFVLHTSQHSYMYSPSVEGYGNYLTAINRYLYSSTTRFSVLKHALLLGTRLLPAVFFHMFIAALFTAVLIVAFATWQLSVTVGGNDQNLYDDW